jgi:hypothetical protein
MGCSGSKELGDPWCLAAEGALLHERYESR